MIVKVITGLIGITIALVFYGVPIIKLKEIPMIVVVLVGVGMMIYEFIEQVREKDED